MHLIFIFGVLFSVFTIYRGYRDYDDRLKKIGLVFLLVIIALRFGAPVLRAILPLLSRIAPGLIKMFGF